MDPSGSSLFCALVGNINIIVASAIVGTDSIRWKQPLAPHLVSEALEKQRIERAGGEVKKNVIENVGEVGQAAAWNGCKHPLYGQSK